MSSFGNKITLDDIPPRNYLVLMHCEYLEDGKWIRDGESSEMGLTWKYLKKSFERLKNHSEQSGSKLEVYKDGKSYFIIDGDDFFRFIRELYIDPTGVYK